MEMKETAYRTTQKPKHVFGWFILVLELIVAGLFIGTLIDLTMGTYQDLSAFVASIRTLLYALTALCVVFVLDDIGILADRAAQGNRIWLGFLQAIFVGLIYYPALRLYGALTGDLSDFANFYSSVAEDAGIQWLFFGGMLFLLLCFLARLLVLVSRKKA